MSPVSLKPSILDLSIRMKLHLIAGVRIWLESEAGKGSTFFFTLTGIQERRKSRTAGDALEK